MAAFGQFTFSGLVNGALFGLIGLGFVLIYRSTGVVNFAQGVFPTVGGMVAAMLWSGSALRVAMAVGGALGTAAVVAWGLARLITSPRLQRELSPLIATVAVSLIAEGILLLAVGGAPLSFSPAGGARFWRLAGVLVHPQDVLVLGVSFLAFAVMEVVFRRTYVGKAMTACAEAPLAARITGLPVRRLGIYACMISGIEGAVAGILLTPMLTVRFDSDVMLAVNGFIAAAIGSLRSPSGALLGGVAVGVVESWVAGYGAPAYELAVALAVMILMLIARTFLLRGDES